MKRFLLGLCLALGLFTSAYGAVPTEVYTLSSTASSNSPGGSENVFPNLDNYLRALQQIIRKNWEWENPTITSAGSSTAYTLTYTNGPGAYYQGQRFSFLVDEANGAAATMNVNGLGAKNIKNISGAALPAGTWTAGQVADLVYDGTNLVYTSPPVLGNVADTLLRIQDDGDATKQIAFQASGITTGTTRTLTVPDADLTVVGTATTQTLTNKTISTASNTITSASTSASGVIQSADQAAMEASTSGRAVTADVLGYGPAIPKAWIRFNGTGTAAVTASYNTTSFTDNGTGNYSFTVSPGLTTVGAVLCTTTNTAGLTNAEVCAVTGISGSTITVRTYEQAVGALDEAIVSVVVWGDI